MKTDDAGLRAVKEADAKETRERLATDPKFRSLIDQINPANR